MRAVALLLAIGAGLAHAEEEKESPLPPQQMEEVVVVGYKDWDFDTRKGALMIGLGGVFMLHEYDKARDEWHFVRASNEPERDKK